MPRKPVESVSEFRITLGDFERQKVTELLTMAKSNVVIDGATDTAKAVGSAVGGLGVWGLAWAALLWVGFDLDETIDNWSDRLKGVLEGRGWVNYTADEVGRDWFKISQELDALIEEAQVLAGAMRTPENEARHRQIMARARVLTRRQEVLKAYVDAITAGDTRGYTLSTYEEGHQMQLNQQWRNWYYQTYGEEPDFTPEWDMRTGEWNWPD